MKKLFELLLIILCLTSCQTDSEINEPELFQEPMVTAQKTTSAKDPLLTSVLLTIGPMDPYICTNDNGFIKSGDIEVILNGPISKDLFIRFNVFKKRKESGNSWEAVPPLIGGAGVIVPSGQDRASTTICKSEITPLVANSCKDHSLQMATLTFKIEISRVSDTDGNIYTDEDISLYNNNNILIIDYGCPYNGGGGFDDVSKKAVSTE